MARQKTLESMFALINKEEMEVCVECDFDTLNTRLEVEKAMESEVVKRSPGRPKKDVQVVLLTPMVKNIQNRLQLGLRLEEIIQIGFYFLFGILFMLQ